MPKLTIELFADITCPWCWIAERRMDRVLSGFPGLEIEWKWRPFQLLPDAPRPGIDWEIFQEMRFGTWEAAERSYAQVTEIGGEVDADFHFDRIAVAPNTVDAHRLVLYASARAKGKEMIDALFSAFFSEGLNIGDRDVLADVASRAGLNREEVRSFLDGDRHKADVQRSQEIAEEAGIRGVPLMILQNEIPVSGAQTEDRLKRAVEKVLAR